MKRTAFLRKKPLRTISPNKVRKKKSEVSKLKKKLWELCKQIIRKRYKNTCYTCKKHPLEASNWQTGHFVPSSISGANLRYDLRNLRPQCYRCNINLSGNGAIFYRNLVQDEGQEYVDQLFRDKQIIIKADESWYLEKIAEYEELLKSL
jgi:hypothetical protein